MRLSEVAESLLSEVVLILVLVEYGLWVKLIQLLIMANGVLILVLVEYGLWEAAK